jgi:hypothetical protein
MQMTSAERALIDAYEPGDVESALMRELDVTELVNVDYSPAGDGSNWEDWN